MSNVPAERGPGAAPQHAAGTTRTRVLASGPVAELLRLQQQARTALLEPQAALAPASGSSPQRTVESARAAAEVSWAVAAMLRRALGRDPDAWVSTTLRVVDSRLQWRPDVAVSTDPLPVDGRAVPALVVEVDSQRPVRPAPDWLACGVREVWTLGCSEVQVVSGPARSARARMVSTGVLAMPLVDAVVDVAGLCAVTR